MQDKRNIENVVQEIMGLVIEHGELCCENNELGHNYRERKIESKLRELVREPLTQEQIERESLHEQFCDGVRFAERAHNITKDS